MGTALGCTMSSDGAGDLAGTQATGAGVDSLGGTGHHRLHTLDIGLPGTVGAAMGVGNLNAERNALTANIAFSQFLHLLVGQWDDPRGHPLKSNGYILADIPPKSKFFFGDVKKT